MEKDFSALAHFQAVGAATESTFPWGPQVKEMDPDATVKATTAQIEAAENTTVRTCRCCWCLSYPFQELECLPDPKRGSSQSVKRASTYNG